MNRIMVAMKKKEQGYCVGNLLLGPDKTEDGKLVINQEETNKVERVREARRQSTNTHTRHQLN